MIGKISGRLDYRGPDHVLIDVRGVGYIVHVSDRTLAQLPAVGGAVALYTELLVREDLMQLFGFPTLLEKEWHRLLVGVQGVGAKAAMAILSTLGADGVGRAIALGDWNAVKAAPGVGPKLAQRVVLELKNKAPGIMAMGATLGAAMGTAPALPDDTVIETPAAPVAPAPRPPSAATAEALSALTNLGYSHGDAASAVAEASGTDPSAETAALIRAALRLLAPKG
ncbi:Holliday junction branch migration protein RuvA [Plastorhodobacter daqingensis]|uniref:Holliday junction branch migration complex subunit RuvA n=1 Tax=Plastorhodobacter daqingensis TaxID=1387281 RepID=A0ABW2UNE9_9RHOB